MGLDNSQKDSINHTLNSNFALIQGPPGTGKTYVGVQIVKILIKYKSYWNSKGPILLVTYTNHALE
jgi:superfamily II DNA or RNA helicase